jgi:opacity protein-like surface antigen
MRMIGSIHRRGVVPLAVAMALAWAAPAVAQDSTGSAYIGLRAIGSVAKINDVGTSGFSGSTLVENDSDEVAGVGFVAGLSLPQAPVRFEIEAAHRFRFDLDVRDVAAPVIDYEVNVATTSLLLSTFLEWRNDSEFTPFIGGTIGWARNAAETTRSNLGGGPASEYDNDEDNLAWGGMVGLDWDFAEQWAAQLAYRYIDLGDVSTGPAPTGESISADEYVSHDVLLSVLFRF